MTIHLVDDTLKVEIFYEKTDQAFSDNVCMRIIEDCPEDEKLFKAHETNLYLTPQQATQLASALARASEKSLVD